jgi:HEAT repeat protein
MIAAGALSDASLLGKFEELVFKQGASDADPVNVAAVWAIANLESAQARPALLRLLEEKAPTIQALAVIGLGRLGSRRDAPVFEKIVSSPDHAQVTRAAAAVALAELGDGRAISGVMALAEASDVVVRAAAISSLTRLEAPGFRAAIAGALVSSDPELVAAGVQAACVLSAGRPALSPRALSIPEGRVDARALLRDLLPNVCSPDAEVAALRVLAPDIAEAAARAAQSSPSQARSVASALLSADGRPAFSPLTFRADAAAPALVEQARAGIEQIARAVVEPFIRLAEHPAADMRQSAVRWLASRPEPGARRVVVAALADADPGVQRTALGALSARPDPATARAVADLLGSAESWSSRRQAAQALGQMGQVARGDEVRAALEAAALGDRYALVRDAASRALFAIHAQAAAGVLERLERTDPEPQVKRTARELLDTLQ